MTNMADLYLARLRVLLPGISDGTRFLYAYEISRHGGWASLPRPLVRLVGAWVAK